MNITIGENIRKKRLELQKTQEQLADALGVSCAAVSKWERGDAYPDITMLFPIAGFFQCSIDELMGYNKDMIETEIQDILNTYTNLYRTDFAKAAEFIKNAYKRYPEDYRIIHYYMWNVAGDYADNDKENLLLHIDELRMLCNKTLDGCTDDLLRLDAWNLLAKLLHAEGKTEEALEIYQTKFGNWYMTSGQKSEQLFAKNTPEFLENVNKNMLELVNFSADKLVKRIFFDETVPYKKRVSHLKEIGKTLTEIRIKTNEAYFFSLETGFYSRFSNDIKYRFGGGSKEDIEYAFNKYHEALEAIKSFEKGNGPLRNLFSV